MYSKKRFHDLIDNGPNIELKDGRVNVGLLNANPFSTGIANLGHQAIANYLMERDINVYIGYADTLGDGKFLNGDLLPRNADFVTISIPFEDTYLNVLRMLDKIGFPIYSKDRDESFPIVIGGGMAMINPIPLSPFLDVVIIGEGRETLYEIINKYQRAKSLNRYSKQDFLYEISGIPGVYIPSHYDISINDDGYVTDFKLF